LRKKKTFQQKEQKNKKKSDSFCNFRKLMTHGGEFLIFQASEKYIPG
jgi:hypothetical protein